ncbi:hypothetical protein GCM10010412_050870 [Nonomuraea recticatena]|uniref:DUF4232 domain-containing protein n=1 Tax=Nonomuraea recticatena TaxID=46178 RepID=A0ABN3S9E7_9ACTN
MRRLPATLAVGCAIALVLALATPASAAFGTLTLTLLSGQEAELENPARGCHSIDSSVKAVNNTTAPVSLYWDRDCNGPPQLANVGQTTIAQGTPWVSVYVNR